MGKSIIFAVNQKHATNLTKIFNEIQPELAVTITSRIPDASSIAKDSATANDASGSPSPWTCCRRATTAATYLTLV